MSLAISHLYLGPFKVTLQFSPDQAEGLRQMEAFIRAPFVNKQWFSLQGYAGAGKSTLMAELVRRHPSLILTAFTGKAASILRRRVKCRVSTLHSVVYNFHGLQDDEFEEGKMNPIFVPKGEPLPERVILVDESSMLGTRNAQDLLETGARVIACGDNGQLPPVRDSRFFEQPDFTLTKIHRQALDSAVIRQAHAVRSEGRYEADGDDFRVVDFANPDELLGHEAVLCWRNRTRMKLNAKKRGLLGLAVDEIQPGEPVICLKNAHELALFNGATYTVAGWRYPELYLRDDNREIAVPMATIEGFDPKFAERQYDDEWLAFAPGHAMTVHKSQGSEYESVLIFDECDTELRRQLLYTGFTRAVERCTVVRWR